MAQRTPLMSGFTPVVVNARQNRGIDRRQKAAIFAVAVGLAMVAIVTVQSRPDSVRRTALGMIGDMAHYNSMHGAFIKGSVPTSAQESDDIMNITFTDDRNGADSEEHMPSAYIRGTKTTFNQEANDIIPGATVQKDMANTESLSLLAVHHLKAKAAKTSKLGMMSDIATIDSIHAAYIKGGVVTSSPEADEIMDVAYPDERAGSDSEAQQPSAYIRGSKVTANDEAKDIIGIKEEEDAAAEDKKEAEEPAEKKAVGGTTALFQTKAKTSKLGMMSDIATINSIHAAYIKGGVTTSQPEADEIMDVAYPDERAGADSAAQQPSAYIRGTKMTAEAEAKDILGMKDAAADAAAAEKKEGGPDAPAAGAKKAVGGTTKLFQEQLKRLRTYK